MLKQVAMLLSAPNSWCRIFIVICKCLFVARDSTVYLQKLTHKEWSNAYIAHSRIFFTDPLCIWCLMACHACTNGTFIKFIGTSLAHRWYWRLKQKYTCYSMAKGQTAAAGPRLWSSELALDAVVWTLRKEKFAFWGVSQLIPPHHFSIEVPIFPASWT